MVTAMAVSSWVLLRKGRAWRSLDDFVDVGGSLMYCVPGG
jgi:hypothetical protein